MKRFISTVRTKMRTLCLLFAILPISVSFCSCRDKTTNNSRQMPKTIIYQLLPRLYSNTREVNKINGSINENGCGKLNEINDAALDNIASLGASYVWYTGVVRHASTTKYPFISHPANANVVKGNAGSPYAICDYYDVDPDLAVDVDHRLDEWKALVERTHKHGLKVLMDFVPNHVARTYYSDARPDIPMFGAADDTTKSFDPQNNFYYLPGQEFVAPDVNKDVAYSEVPAKASGNDAFTACPSKYDWYETVKLNYGVDYQDDGTKHFDPRPDTWVKMRDILLFWVSTGVDGFRVDMAQMVPVEFWSWVISQVTSRHPNVIFMGEIYDTSRYQDFVNAGFNILYDKMNFYDIVRAVVCGSMPASDMTHIWRRTENVGKNMLYFLENHDEQRIASDSFAIDPLKARPAYIAALTMGRGSIMLYAGQELGERGMDNSGFSGIDGRTTIFDYWSVGSLRRNVSGFNYDGANLLPNERDLRSWYSKVNNTIQNYETFSTGEFYDLMWVNQHIWVDSANVYAYLRYSGNERFLVALNFAATSRRQRLRIPDDAWKLMGSSWNECIQPSDLLGNAIFIGRDSVNNIKENGLEVEIPAHDAIILKF